MARGQSLSLRCPKCRRFAGVKYLDKCRKRRYTHGHCSGLPSSYGQWLVACLRCGHSWYSRHPDARRRAGYPEYETDLTSEQIEQLRK